MADVFKKIKSKTSVSKAVVTSVRETFRATKRTPEELYQDLIEANDTRFSEGELEKLFAAFTRLTSDRLQKAQFSDLVKQEVGWQSALLRDQLFKAYDTGDEGELTFYNFCMGYSIFLRGTVQELERYTWKLFKVSETAEDVVLKTDILQVVEHSVACLDDVRKRHGAHIGTIVDTRFPEKTAALLVDEHIPAHVKALSRTEFKRLVLSERKFVDGIIPAFQFIPNDPVHHAAEIGEADECTSLVKVDSFDVDGRDASQFPLTPLHIAAQYGHDNVFKALLDLGANPRLLDPEGYAPIHLAVIHDRSSIVEVYIDKKLDLQLPSAKKESAYHLAAWHPHGSIMTTMVSKLPVRLDAFVDNEGNTPVHSAAASNNWKILQLALDKDKLGVNSINQKNDEGNTPLNVACAHKAVQTVQMLLKLGADPTLTNNFGENALHACLKVRGNDDVLSLLLSDGRCEINQVDCKGCTALTKCVDTRDLKMLKKILEKGADINIVEAGIRYTPLHRAVMADWVQGVELLLAQDECKFLKDQKGNSALDYARDPKISTMLKEHVLRVHPAYSHAHPIQFHYALIFYDGNWVLQSEGELRNKRVFKASKVSRTMASARAKRGLVDKKTIKARLNDAGLVVLEEPVYKQSYVAGVIKGDVKQYTVMRIGAPLYRLQQQAMKIRHLSKRIDVDLVEHFFLDDHTYPATGFHDFTHAERVKLILSIVQGVPNSHEFAVGSSEDADGKHEPDNCGISLPLYKDYKVIYSYQLVHNHIGISRVLGYWGVSKAFSFSYMISHLAEFVNESKENKFKALKALVDYFGHKIAFYFGFFSFYTGWLLAPAVVGIVVFGIQYIPSEYDSMIDNSNEVDQDFDDQYDHPLMFAYAFFIMLWAPIFLRQWGRKQKELAHTWHVDQGDKDVDHTPNPYADSLPRLMYADGTWQYRNETSSEQRKFRQYNLYFITIPIFVFFYGLVGGYLVGLKYLDDYIDDQDVLHDNFDNIYKSLNWYGTFAMYGAGAAHAIMIFVLNRLFRGVATWLTIREHQESHVKFERSLTIKLLTFMIVNTNFGLFYFAYWVKEIDKTAMHLASIIVVTWVLKAMGEFIFPWFKYGSSSGKKGKNKVVPTIPQPLMSDAASKGAIKEEKVAEGRMAESTGPGRMEVEAKYTSAALDFSDVVIQFGLITMWGSVWPLCALVAYMVNLIEIHIAAWKYCTYYQRPFSVRIGNIPHFWLVAFEALAILGIANQCFVLGYSSKTMEEYFFPRITRSERLFAAFVAENFFALCYLVLRLVGGRGLWVQEKKREPLRYIRDAYRVGTALRERMQQVLALNPAATLADVAEVEEVDEDNAQRYLLVVRYLDSLGVDERKKILRDSNTTINSLLGKIRSASGWVDPGEQTTSASILQDVVPIKYDLKRCYLIGKALREKAYKIWVSYQKHKDGLSDGNPLDVLHVRQLACIEEDCTLEQAQRYVRLVRYIDGYMPGNPFQNLSELQQKHPGGLLAALDTLGALHGQDDPGEPQPGALGPFIEPRLLAKDVFAYADVIRRTMFEAFVANPYFTLDELIEKASQPLGMDEHQIRRSLMVKRYCESLGEQKTHVILNVKQTETLILVQEIEAKEAAGDYKDAGERSFRDYTPPIVETTTS